jgi:HPt (histidine-containing phosphotransfer) domain-containing protein
MTAATLRGDRQKCLEAGMNDYIGKPIMPGLLQDILKKWSDGDPHDKTAGAPPPETEAALAALDEAHLESVQSFADSHPPAGFGTWVRAFLDDLKLAEETLTLGRETEDWPLATQAARQLMLDCGGFGAPRLRELARELVTELERNGEAGAGERFDALVPRMKRECEALREVLERRIGNGG